MKRTALVTAGLSIISALFVGGAQAAPVAAAAAPSPATCSLGTERNPIQRVVFIVFDNVHLTRDNPNVPSDLEQMPALLDGLKQFGVLLDNHHTPLISHTSVDILTALTGVYGDKMGIPVGNSFRYYNPDGSTNGASSFAYWTDPVATFSGQEPTDTTPEMIDQRGKVHPAPWVPFTRAGCDVGAFSVANIELENIGLDITTVFGAGSPEEQEAHDNPTLAMADFMGIAVHCAQNSPRCGDAGKPDLLPDEPGGYDGFPALYGNKYVQPQISPGGPVDDIDGNPITDSDGNYGFPNQFNPSASQTLGYLATMLEAGVSVVYGYISDMHDNHFTGNGTFGPGETGYVQQLAAANDAFSKFMARLAADGITSQNTLFVVTSDENDHFVGGPPSPINCDGITTPCTYAQIGEVNADLSRVLATERGNATPFTVHSDDAPTFYIGGNPDQTADITRGLERDTALLEGINPITGRIEPLMQAMVDHAGEKFLHMVTADPKRTPTFILFANPDYFLFATGNTSVCDPLEGCFVEQSGFAWNHGDFQEEITRTWLAMVGPGVRVGAVDRFFTDHADIRPTMLALLGLVDDYPHDGRPIFEIMTDDALPPSVQLARGVLTRLGRALKEINAPLATLGHKALALNTVALAGDDTTYAVIEAGFDRLTVVRDLLARRMVKLIEGAVFQGQPVDSARATRLIHAAEDLILAVP